VTPPACQPGCVDGGVQNADCSIDSCGLLGACNTSRGAPECMSILCVTDEFEQPAAHSSCLGRSILVSCDDVGQAKAFRCGTACETASAIEAQCVGGSSITAINPEDTLGGGALDESSRPNEADPVDPRFADAGLSSGCSVQTGTTNGPWQLLLVAVFLIRRRRNKNA